MSTKNPRENGTATCLRPGVRGILFNHRIRPGSIAIPIAAETAIMATETATELLVISCYTIPTTTSTQHAALQYSGFFRPLRKCTILQEEIHDSKIPIVNGGTDKGREDSWYSSTASPREFCAPDYLPFGSRAHVAHNNWR